MAGPARPVRSAGEDPPAGGAPLRLQILGPMRLWRDGVEVSASPRQQAQLLALLLARAGRPTSVTELIDLIWGDDASVSALNVIHKYVSGLRRLLEPAVVARAAGSYLHTRGNGLPVQRPPRDPGPRQGRELRDAARTALAEPDHEAALDS